jgi:hypothetical protein
MQIPAVKISALFLATLSLGMAQDAPSPAAASASPSPFGSATPQSQSPSPEAGTSRPPATDTSAALDYLFNQKPQDGTAGKQALDASKHASGKAIAQDAVGGGMSQQDEQAKVRYVQYLGTPEVSQETLNEYLSKMKQVSNLLAANKLVDAWQQLRELANYDSVDAGISGELANRVEAVWTTGKATANINRNNDQLRKDVGAAARNADLMSEEALKRNIQYQQKVNAQRRNAQGNGNQMPAPNIGSGNNAQAPSISGLEGKLQMTEQYLRSLELKAKIKVNELKQEKLYDQAKSDFADYVQDLYQTGRLNHVVLAADFYRKVFQEGIYPAEMAKQVNASLEKNRQAQSNVEVFRYKVERGEVAGANDSLREAFAINELNPSLLGVPRELKQEIASFNRRLSEMRNLIEARDFGNLEKLIAEVKSSASDFDAAKPRALVNAAKLESRLRLGKAKLAAQQGDLQLAMKEFQAAAEAWPDNPELQNNATTFFETQDLKSQSLVEFDRLVEEKNYRAVFDRQLAFAPAIKGDAKREEALKNALLIIKDAEVASEKANVLMVNGDYFGAWETIELAAANLPDDKKLNKLRADLSGRSAEFVSSVNKARDAEGRSEVGYALVWYVNAQRQYPASRIANDGIERLSKKLLQASM